MNHRIVGVLCVVAALGCAGPRPVELGGSTPTDIYRIAPPDVLTILIRPQPAITTSHVVRPDGRISVELIGVVDVRGKLVSEVQAEITRRLREFIVQPEVTVTLASTHSRYF